MLPILLEHHEPKSARRALLACSTATIFLSGVSVTGGHVDLLGLTLEVRENQVLTTARLLTLYFAWIYVWLNFARILSTAQEFVFKKIDQRIETERDKANSVDVNPYENEYDDDYGPPDPWWVDFDHIKQKLTKLRGLAANCTKWLTQLSVLSIEYLPPISLSISAILFPEQVNDWLYSAFNR